MDLRRLIFKRDSIITANTTPVSAKASDPSSTKQKIASKAMLMHLMRTLSRMRSCKIHTFFRVFRS